MYKENLRLKLDLEKSNEDLVCVLSDWRRIETRKKAVQCSRKIMWLNQRCDIIYILLSQLASRIANKEAGFSCTFSMFSSSFPNEIIHLKMNAIQSLVHLNHSVQFNQIGTWQTNERISLQAADSRGRRTGGTCPPQIYYKAIEKERGKNRYCTLLPPPQPNWLSRSAPGLL